MKKKLMMSNLFGKNLKNNKLQLQMFFEKRYFFENIIFLKFRHLYNLNLLCNHNFYNNFFFFLKNLEKNLIIFYLLKNNFFKINVVPNFLFSKQIFFDFKKFLNFSNKNKLKFLFIKNKNFNLLNNSVYGNNFILISKNDIDVNSVNFLKNEFNIDLFRKNYSKLDEFKKFNIILYFLNFNLFMLNIVDIYKILILLTINNCIKSN